MRVFKSIFAIEERKNGKALFFGIGVSFFIVSANIIECMAEIASLLSFFVRKRKPKGIENGTWEKRLLFFIDGR